MENVSVQMSKFRDFLNHSWADLDLLMSEHDWDEDGNFTNEWVQVNWEFLVERQLLKNNGFLQTYANSNRVSNPDALVTNFIVCVPKANEVLYDDKTNIQIPENLKLVFSDFEKKLDVSYGWYPPFDYATVYTEDRKKYFDVPVKSIEFILE